MKGVALPGNAEPHARDVITALNEQLVEVNCLRISFSHVSPSCFEEETAKIPFGLQVKLPPVHLSTTHIGGSTVLFYR